VPNFWSLSLCEDVRMPTLKDHEGRITALEGRTDQNDEILESHSESIYKLRRESIENRLGMHTLLDHFGLPRVMRHEIDEVLDTE
jgi:hypothetical protein